MSTTQSLGNTGGQQDIFSQLLLRSQIQFTCLNNIQQDKQSQAIQSQKVRSIKSHSDKIFDEKSGQQPGI